jgi:hypothetical protein
VTGEEWALAASAFFSGLAAGFLGGLCMIVRPMQAAMDPTYNVILAWNPEALPADWEAGRRRYFTINWIQLAVTWAAFALFLVALISL